MFYFAVKRKTLKQFKKFNLESYVKLLYNLYMKTVKQMPKPRNCFVVLAIKRKAGSHKKPYKSLRGELNRGSVA